MGLGGAWREALMSVFLAEIITVWARVPVTDFTVGVILSPFSEPLFFQKRISVVLLKQEKDLVSP